jgi:DNA-binding response OmpR family regulator
MSNQQKMATENKLFVIEDERDFYFLIEQRLEQEGYEVLDTFSHILTRSEHQESLSYVHA